MEIEAKFIVADEATYRRLQQAKRFGPYTRHGAVVKVVRDLYLDTAGHAFLKRGMAVRARTDKDGEILLTIKGITSTFRGAIHRREEHQVTVPGLDPQSWPKSDVQHMVIEGTGGEPLVEMVSLEQTRTVSDLYLEERRVAELSIDHITLWNHRGGKRRSSYEIEVELLHEGRLHDLHTIAQVLVDDYRLRPQILSKFEQALNLSGIRV